jgi:hypothetical protein
MFKAIREFITGRYESAPIRLMDEDDCRQWVIEHPFCSHCRRPIYPDRDNYRLVNSSTAGISAHHISCPR